MHVDRGETESRTQVSVSWEVQSHYIVAIIYKFYISILRSMKYTNTSYHPTAPWPMPNRSPNRFSAFQGEFQHFFTIHITTITSPFTSFIMWQRSLSLTGVWAMGWAQSQRARDIAVCMGVLSVQPSQNGYLTKPASARAAQARRPRQSRGKAA